MNDILNAWNFKTGYRDSNYLPDRIWIEEQFLIIAIINNIISKACNNLTTDTISTTIKDNLFPKLTGKNNFNILGTYANDTPWSLDSNAVDEKVAPFESEICLSLTCFNGERINNIFNPPKDHDLPKYNDISFWVYSQHNKDTFLSIEEEDAKNVLLGYDHRKPKRIETKIRHKTFKHYAFFNNYLTILSSRTGLKKWHPENVKATMELLEDKESKIPDMLIPFRGGGVESPIQLTINAAQRAATGPETEGAATSTVAGPETEGAATSTVAGPETEGAATSTVAGPETEGGPATTTSTSNGTNAVKSYTDLTTEETTQQSSQWEVLSSKKLNELEQIKKKLNEELEKREIEAKKEAAELEAKITKMGHPSETISSEDIILKINEQIELTKGGFYSPSKLLTNFEKAFFNKDTKNNKENPTIVTRINKANRAAEEPADGAKGGFRKKRSSKGRKNKRKSTKKRKAKKRGSKLRKK
jgi:hypothetical protein